MPSTSCSCSNSNSAEEGEGGEEQEQNKQINQNQSQNQNNQNQQQEEENSNSEEELLVSESERVNLNKKEKQGENSKKEGGKEEEEEEMDCDKIQVAFQTRMGEQMVRMTSTLVETVSINYEDFNESFLTCGTCLCSYNGGLNNPKLLPCSHTVCLDCLGRIAAASSTTTNASGGQSTPSSSSGGSGISGGVREVREPVQHFRCPICRELIAVPRGGVSALPPSFLVNQLLDLMASQRREVIPKCSVHSNQELLFCEVCDCVFCAVCVTSPHSVSSSGDHTVIPFSLAIKRMSEILLYKANECLSKLDEASESVGEEMKRLDEACDKACEVTNKAFENAVQLLEKRRQSYIAKIREVSSAKKGSLGDQLELIEKEKSKVSEACEGLEYQVEVRQITKRISELAAQLDSFISLRNPRENAYLICKTQSELGSLESAVTSDIRTSTTFPPLSTLKVEPGSLLCCGVEVEIILETRDYHDRVRKEGGDPVNIKVLRPNGLALSSNSNANANSNGETSNPAGVRMEDNEDGTYLIRFTPTEIGTFTVRVDIFGRPIKDEEFCIEITSHNNPTRLWGRGDLNQPVGIAKADNSGEIFLLDTGNARICVIDHNLNMKRVLANEALQGRSCTGIAYCHKSESVLIVNWRTKQVSRISPRDGTTVANFTHPDFVEPIAISVDGCDGSLFVADNGQKTIFVFDSEGKPKKHVKRSNFNLLGGVCVLPDGKTIIVADTSLFIIDLNCADGSTDKEIKVPGKGRFGGVVVDKEGTIIATRTEKTRSFVQVFKDHALTSTIDSFSAKLRRPSDLAMMNSKNILVVDLGNDCVKEYRFK